MFWKVLTRMGVRSRLGMCVRSVCNSVGVGVGVCV